MTNNKIPILDLNSEIEQLWDQLNTAIQTVLHSARFIMGEEVALLEQELANYLNVKHAITVNSGTDALVIALKALGVKSGDEVLTTAFTFFATAEAISLVGATPVFVDIDPDTFNLDAQHIASKITKRTKAIVPVHLFGQSVDLDPILEEARKHNLYVIEDTAQAFGAEYKGVKCGTLGDVGAYSFFPTKNLGAYGDGGLVVTNDDILAEKMRMLRMHGARKKYYNEMLGYNSRLDTLQAAILRVKLPYVDQWNQSRWEAAQRYNALLSDCPNVKIPVEVHYSTHVYHQYTLRILGGRRDTVKTRLAEACIETMVYYPVPVHKLPVYAWSNMRLPHTEQAADEVLSLPMWPSITLNIQRRVVDYIKKNIYS